MKLTILVLSLVTITNSIFGQKQSLGFNLKAGDSYFHNMQCSSSIIEEVNGQKINIDLNISGKIAFQITRFKDSVYDMKVSYERLAMIMKLPDKNVEFNSEKKDESDVFSTILGQIIGKQFFVKMTKVGKIIEVKNLDAIFGNILDSFPKISPEKRNQIMAQMRQAYGEKAFKGNFDMVTSIYPNIYVGKGDTWEVKTNIESTMSATLVTTYEFKDKTEKYNLIVGTGKFETSDKSAFTEISGMPIRYDLTGNMKASLKVDSKTGWIIEADITQLINGTAEIKDSPKMTGGMKIPMSFENIIVYSPTNINK